MHSKDKARLIHFMVSLLGGFIGTYSLIHFNYIFASAQTTNIASFLMDLVGRDFPQALVRLGAIIVYVLGLTASVIIPHYTRMNLQRLSLYFSMLAMVALVFIPEWVNPFVTLYPLFFVTAFQWCVFKGAGGYAVSSIFSTNNLKQFSTSLVAYHYEKDKELLHKARIYGSALLFFYTGTLIALLSSFLMGRSGILIGLVPALVSLSLIAIQEREVEVTRVVKTCNGK